VRLYKRLQQHYVRRLCSVSQGRLGRCILLGVVASLTTFLSGAQAPSSGDGDVEEIVARIRTDYDIANKALKTFKSDRLNPEVVVEAADFDARRIVDWVENNTRWIPYEGVLRGARGVLADRHGNALDRSLLLAELLQQAGYETRLARTTLPSLLAGELLRRETSREAAPGIQNALTAAGRDAARRAVSQAQALQKIARLPPDAAAAEQVSDQEAAADHWWIQARLEDTWKDLDPLFPGQQAARRPAPVALHRSENLPEGLFHRVTVRVVIERWENGRVSEETPVEHTLKTADAVAQDVEVHFVPYGAQAQPADANEERDAFNALLNTAQDWLPVLLVAGKRITDKGFGSDGRLETNPNRPAVERKIGQAVKAVGALGASNQKPDSILSACWIEYQVVRPGGRPERVRREIFDLIGPERRRERDFGGVALDESAISRRGSALIGGNQILIINSEPPPALFFRAFIELWAKTGPLIAAVVRLGDDPDVEEPRKRLSRGYVFPMDLLALAVLRETLSTDAASTSLDRPNIFANHYFFAAGLESLVYATDIVYNRVAIAPGAGAGIARTVRTRQGVLDTVIETVLTRPPKSRVYNPADLFDRTAETGPWTIWRDVNAVPQGFPIDARARMGAAVEARRVVVAPARLPANTEASWWEIDPLDGTTLGIGVRGWGPDIEEEEELEASEDPRVHRVSAEVRERQLCNATESVETLVELGSLDTVGFYAIGPFRPPPLPEFDHVRFIKICEE
jgi:hypothetical protein